MQEFLEKQLKVFKENCVSRKGEKLLIRTEPFQSGDKILREMTVLSCMEEVAGQAKDLSAVHVADVSTLFGKQCGRQIMLPYHMRAVRGYEGVTLEKVHAAREKRDTAPGGGASIRSKMPYSGNGLLPNS